MSCKEGCEAVELIKAAPRRSAYGLSVESFKKVGLIHKIEKVVWKVYDVHNFTNVTTEKYQLP